jgi:hypothetical protein
MTLDEAITALYVREINCGCETFWDGGIRVWIGDRVNGHKVGPSSAATAWVRRRSGWSTKRRGCIRGRFSILRSAGEDRLEIGAEHHRARMRPGDDAVALDRPACSKAADLLDAIGGHGGSLAAAKARGVKLGSPTGAETIGKARAARTEQAAKANATTRAVIAEIQRTSAGTLKAIAQELEARGVRTPAGRSTWAPAQVSRLMDD